MAAGDAYWADRLVSQNTAHCTLHNAHYTLHTAHCTQGVGLNQLAVDIAKCFDGLDVEKPVKVQKIYQC